MKKTDSYHHPDVWLVRSDTLAAVPVLIVTSSDAAEDRSTASLGASGYFRKPTDLDEFLNIGEVIRGLAAGAGH